MYFSVSAFFFSCDFWGKYGPHHRVCGVRESLASLYQPAVFVFSFLAKAQTQQLHSRERISRPTLNGDKCGGRGIFMNNKIDPFPRQTPSLTKRSVVFYTRATIWVVKKEKYSRPPLPCLAFAPTRTCAETINSLVWQQSRHNTQPLYMASKLSHILSPPASFRVRTLHFAVRC